MGMAVTLLIERWRRREQRWRELGLDRQAETAKRYREALERFREWETSGASRVRD